MPSTLAAVIEGEPAKLGHDVPQDLDRIIIRCLKKDPERRFQHMGDVKVALEELREQSDSGRLGEALGALEAPEARRWKMVWVAGAVAALIARGFRRLAVAPAAALRSGGTEGGAAYELYRQRDRPFVLP